MFDAAKLQQVVDLAIQCDNQRAARCPADSAAPEAKDNSEVEAAAAPPSAELIEQRRGALLELSSTLSAVQQRCAGLQSNLRAAQAATSFLDASSSSFLPEVMEMVDNLEGGTRRFSVLIDLMASASQLLDTSTYQMACACVSSHCARCHVQLADAERLVQTYPQFPKASRACALS